MINHVFRRYIFWLQVGLHGLTSLGLLLFYWPKKRTDYPKMSFKELVWACDPIGSLLLVGSATLMLLALNWAGGAYKWSEPHVCANLVIGIVLFIAFCVYGTGLPAPTVFSLTQHRVERSIRRHCRSRVLCKWTQFLAINIRFHN